MNNNPKSIQIPISVYQNVVNHLKTYAKVNKEAATCLEQLSNEARRVDRHKTSTGTYILNSNRSAKYEWKRYIIITLALILLFYWGFDVSGE